MIGVSMTSLEEKLHEAMINIYKSAVKECNYRAKAFLAMVVEMGGLQAAKKLLASDVIQSGVYELFECGRPDLTVETLVLKDEFRELFEAKELSKAKRRLGLLNASSRQE